MKNRQELLKHAERLAELRAENMITQREFEAEYEPIMIKLVGRNEWIKMKKQYKKNQLSLELL